MNRKLFAFSFFAIAFLSTCSVVAQPQIYFAQHRPPGMNWQVLKTDHFRIIYPGGQDSLAFRAGRILEHQYPLTESLTGGSLKNFPVVLTNYNDLTNGFVTPINFRSEVDLAPFKGKAINPASGSWMEAVLPHELLHANHGNVMNPISIPGFVSLFSPDLARTYNFFPPVGLHEGLAVYHESENGISENSGRGNYTYFNNQFNANISGGSEWSMGQTFHVSDYSLPFNRHYIAGYTFTDWLHDEYGEDVSKKTINTHLNLFFLGYGFALRQVTGKWPGELYKDYNIALKKREEERKNFLSSSTDEKHHLYPLPVKGLRQRGPVWVSPSEIVFYSSQYNAPRGFYKLNILSKKSDRLKESVTVGDFNIEYDNRSNSLLFSEYFSRGVYTGAYLSDIIKMDVASASSVPITNRARTYSPTVSKTGYLALKTNESSADIVSVAKSGNLQTIKSFDDTTTPVFLSSNPANRDQVAVILNKRGVQALWITSLQTMNQDLDGLPTLAFKQASVHDPAWHPSGNKLLFTVDGYPAMNIFEYNLETEKLLQLTKSEFNAMEADYSPDGRSIAYISQQGQEQVLAVLKEEDFYNQPVDSSETLKDPVLIESLNTPLLGESLISESTKWKTSPYKNDLRWLKPRAILPVTKDKSGSTEFGAQITSTDVLQSQSYSVEITGIQNRLWYNATYTNRTFFPGFQISGYSEPSFFTATDPGNNTSFGYMLQERGFEFSVPVFHVFRNIARASTFFFSPSFSIEQVRYYNLTPEPLSDFGTQYKAGGFTQLSLKILQQSRDVQQSSGLSLFVSAEKALNDPEVQFQFPSGARGTISPLAKRYGFYYGIIGFVSPLRKLNQSLRLDLQFLQQSDNLLYSTDTIIPLGYADDIFPQTPNLSRFSLRYAIPLIYPDDGGLLVPAYLRSIYLTLFSHTVTDIDAPDLFNTSRSVYGAGVHFQFNISNLGFNIGFGIGYEPTRNQAQFIFGDF